MSKLAIFASGNGTNAEAIMTFFEKNPDMGEVAVVISNNSKAYVLERAKNHGVDSFVFGRSVFYEDPKQILDVLSSKRVDWIILAGFMLLVNPSIVDHFDGKIINIHPALLPKFGGKGMYGHHVHEAVVAAGEPQSGITIHFVNKHYDQGAVIFQATCDINKTDTADDVAAKIHDLEQTYFSKVISNTINR